MRMTTRWNWQNEAINHDYSGIKPVCDFTQNLGDLRLWLCHRDWYRPSVTLTKYEKSHSLHFTQTWASCQSHWSIWNTENLTLKHRW
jgi:hypothetical protein